MCMYMYVFGFNTSVRLFRIGYVVEYMCSNIVFVASASASRLLLPAAPTVYCITDRWYVVAVGIIIHVKFLDAFNFWLTFGLESLALACKVSITLANLERWLDALFKKSGDS